MPLRGNPKQCTATAKGTKKRCCNPAVDGYSVCRMHGAGNKKTPNQGNLKHGRYSRLKREALRSLIEQYEQDPEPLNILPELAAARALFQDFIDRYDEFAEALIAWHQSYQVGNRPIDKYKVDAFIDVVDQYEELIASQDSLTDRQRKALEVSKEFVTAAQKETGTKPLKILDISDAYRIVSEVTKIAERIERIRAANAVSQQDLVRIMTEMGRVVQTYVSEEKTLEKIKTGWLSVKI